MKRIAIFSHYDKHNIIDEYVIHYLNELKKTFEHIIFVSDCNLNETEINKIKDVVSYIKAYNHGEYDWGSYKYGYIIAKENNLLTDADELLFCNDSVYGPITSMDVLYKEMTNDKCDFWGLYENKFGLDGVIEPHLQSWFLLMKKNVFLSDEFDKFILNVKKEENKTDIIKKYEIGFTTEMKKHFSYKSAYISEETNAVTVAAPLLLEKGFPFIKVVVFKKYLLDYKKYIENDLFIKIKSHKKRTSSEPIMKNIFRTMKVKRKMKKYKIDKNY